MLLTASMSLSRYNLLLLCFLSPLAVVAQELTFYVGAPQSPPIIYKDSLTGRFKGIVPDILNSMPPEHQVSIDYIQHNRSRGEDALYNNEVDATILTKEWASNPDKLIFTRPIYKHQDFIYSNQAQYPMTDLEQTIAGKDICTRRGYIYPELEYFFQQDLADRVDTSSEETELRMLLLNRCQLAVMNEFIADWLINNNAWQGDIHQLNLLNSIDFTMAFTPAWREFVDKLNQHIDRIEQNGELEKIINENRRTQ